jgi:VIT1/CCC1 family predicted Fe2+/Mn2+ transporter
VQGVLKGMTLSGAMALAIGDESRFEIIHDRQKAIIHALEVLGINSGEWES